MKFSITFITILALSIFSCKEESVKLSYDQIAIKYYWELTSLTIIEQSERNIPIVTDSDVVRFDSNGKYYKVNDTNLGLLGYPELGDWKVLDESILQLDDNQATITSWDENELIYVLDRDLGSSGTVKLEIKRRSLKINTP